MMRDLYVKFDSEADWQAFGLERDPGLLEFDEIGHMRKVIEPAEFDANGRMTKPPVEQASTSWRVNIRSMDDRDLTALDPYRVFPATPARVWAS